MNLLIHDATIITLSAQGTIKNGAIAIKDQHIVDVGKTSELKRKYSGYEKINVKGKVVVPGFVNTHQHAAMSLLRGYADDLPLQEWLEKWIWPVEKHMSGQDIRVGALLTAVESVMSGTTTVNTMYHYAENGNEAEAFAEVGVRGVVGHVCFSWRKEEDRKALEALAKNWHGKADGRIRVSVDPHAPYTVDPEYMQELRQTTRELNQKYGRHYPVLWHVHMAETADEPEKIRRAFGVDTKDGVVEYLDSLGVLENDVVAAHCVHLTPRDVAILGKRGVKVSHNPISNLKLGSGICPVPKLVKSGVTVTLGTDSPCSNNSADMLEVMKTAALLHKGVQKNPTLLPAEQVLRMATIESAKALLWDKQIGSIEMGKEADLAIVDFRKPHLRPVFSEISHLVYAAKAADVDTVLVKGKILMENRRLTTLNLEGILEMAEKTKARLFSKLQR